MRKIQVLFLSLFFLSSSYAQDFKGHVSGTFGILNPKIRLQYEHPIQQRFSIGANLNYYMVNWTGPVIEPFARLYNKKDGCKEGFFLQGKLIYGNLKAFEELADVSVQRWSTFGLGVGTGYKFLIGKAFTIEPYFGVRFLSGPSYEIYEPTGGAEIGETIGWYITTGFPLDFQLKFGYQF